MLPSVLILDDEVEVLSALKRVLRKHFNVIAFTDANDALTYFAQSPTQIVLSDMQMPNMNGAEFLSQIKNINNRCKRVVLTGFADTDLAKKAINEGSISLYIDKPWDNNVLLEMLLQLIQELKKENHKLNAIKKIRIDHKKLLHDIQVQNQTEGLNAEEHANTQTQNQKLKLINNELLQFSANLISLYTGDPTNHNYRCAEHAKALAKRLKLTTTNISQIHTAALFYRVGMATLSPEVQSTPWLKLTNTQKLEWLKFPEASAEILQTVNVLNNSATIVKHIFEHVDGTGLPNKLTQDNIPLGSKVLAIVCLFDQLVSGTYTGQKMSTTDALLVMKERIDESIDKSIYIEFSDMITDKNAHMSLEIGYTVEQLRPGMITAQDVFDNNNHKLLAERVVLSDVMIKKLREYQSKTNDNFIVYVNNKAGIANSP